MTVPGKPKKTLVLLSSVRHPDEGGGGVVGTDLANGFNDIVDDDAECDTDPSDSEKARTNGKSSLWQKSFCFQAIFYNHLSEKQAEKLRPDEFFLTFEFLQEFRVFPMLTNDHCSCCYSSSCDRYGFASKKSKVKDC